jgi:two-component system, cell cycle response regulator
MGTHKPEQTAGITAKKANMLREGRRMYLAELGKQLDQMQKHLQLEVWNRELASRFYHMLHTVKGSAPVFGLDRVGSLALSHIMQWEWASEEEEGAQPPDMAEVAVKGRELWERLRMEWEVSHQELELDEKEKQYAPDTLRIKGSRVLLIDDDEVLRIYLERRLKLDGYQVDEADGVQSGLRLLREQKYDLVLLDLMMQPQSGYELFEILKEDPTLKWIPLIVLSGRNDVVDKVRCFHLGADDYVTKPFQYDELEARIYSLIKRTKTFEQMAFRDPLTGVNNRRYFDHQLELELQRAVRYPSPLSIIFIDIDRFKRVNDTYGHATGDLVLQGLAYLLQQNLRASDLLARFGGEEFVVVMPNTLASDAQAVMEGILDRVREAPIATHDGVPHRITFSAGVAEWMPGDTKEDWIRRADQAMYAAKQEGRDRVLHYEAGMGSASEAAPSVGEQATAARKKLLIADDDAILRSLLAGQFKDEPVDILEAGDGEEALQLIREHEPDAAILDGLMPKLGGLELMDLIRDDATIAKKPKVLMLSGRGKRKDVVQGLQSGADDYMSKPFSVPELELRVKRLLNL